MLVLNDVHVGVQRKAGTTPKSQEALRSYLLNSFAHVLTYTEEIELLIAGDLFDEFEVSPRDWIDTYEILARWLKDPVKLLTLMSGNHDHSPRALRVSSFEMLGKVLEAQFPDRVRVVGIDQSIQSDYWAALAHCSNQETFETKLREMLQLDVKTIFLHANYNNNFAAQTDHSLNVTADLAHEFAAKGVTLVFAHEHQARWAKFMGHDGEPCPGSVVVMGNQWPTSISDCLNNNQKFCYIFRREGVSTMQTWDIGSIADGYSEIDWRGLEAAVTPPGFIRVVGEATAGEAGDVISAIAKFRQKSEAFVISNAVRIDGIVKPEDLPDSFEAVKRFDVMSYIEKHLEPDEMAVVNKLLGVEAAPPAFIED